MIKIEKKNLSKEIYNKILIKIKIKILKKNHKEFEEKK